MGARIAQGGKMSGRGEARNGMGKGPVRGGGQDGVIVGLSHPSQRGVRGEWEEEGHVVTGGPGGVGGAAGLPYLRSLPAFTRSSPLLPCPAASLRLTVLAAETGLSEPLLQGAGRTEPLLPCTERRRWGSTGAETAAARRWVRGSALGAAGSVPTPGEGWQGCSLGNPPTPPGFLKCLVSS